MTKNLADKLQAVLVSLERYIRREHPHSDAPEIEGLLNDLGEAYDAIQQEPVEEAKP